MSKTTDGLAVDTEREQRERRPQAALTTRSFGSYRLVAGIGQGGMAQVYLALSKKQGGFSKLLVLKVMRLEFAEDAEFRTMFLDEARIAARLNHPNVIHTYEVGEDQGTIFIAMEYLEGQSLGAILSRVGPAKVPLELQLRILCDTLLGLHYAHDLVDFDGTNLHLVHRDVSPQNILVSYSGHSKIVDFGIAKMSGSSVTQTKAGVLKGKVGYMAPEQVLSKNVDRRADIFACGVLLWEALAKKRLVPRTENEVAAMSRRVSGDPTISEIAPDAPAELRAICERAMALNPDDRYATALEMHAELDRYLGGMRGAETRDVAQFLDLHFAKEREQVKRLVEEQVRASNDSLPMLNVQTQVSSHAGSGGSSPSGRRVMTDSGAGYPSSGSVPVRSSSRTLAIAAAVLLVTTVAAAVVARGRMKPPPTIATATAAPPSAVVAPDTASGSASATAAPPTTTTAAAPAASLTVRVTPKNAILTIDGKPVANPFVGELPKTDGNHVLVARAFGYQTEERSVTPGSEVELVLKPAGRTGAIAPPPQPPPQPPPRPTGKTEDPDVSPRPGKKPKHSIDDQDPYAK